MNGNEKSSNEVSGATLWARLALAYFKKQNDDLSKAIAKKLTERCDNQR